MSYLVSPQYGGATSQIHRSMYENISSAGFAEEQMQHFVEWFSGDALDSIWTLTTGTIGSAGSGAMSDAVNGGYVLTSASGDAVSGDVIGFNNIQHYSETGSVIQGVIQYVTGTAQQLTKIVLTSDSTTWDALHYGQIKMDSSGDDFFLTTRGGSTTNSTNMSVTRDTNPHLIKVKLQSSSVLGYEGNILRAVNTANLPSVTLEPSFGNLTRDTTSREGRVICMEVFNT